MNYKGDNMSNCKGCGAAIIWIKTEKGKNMPIDGKPIKVYVKADIPTGPLGAYTLVNAHLPHWGTCPKVSEFKKKKG